MQNFIFLKHQATPVEKKKKKKKTNPTIIYKIFETAIFRDFFASINKIFILAGRLDTSLSLHEV